MTFKNNSNFAYSAYHRIRVDSQLLLRTPHFKKYLKHASSRGASRRKKWLKKNRREAPRDGILGSFWPLCCSEAPRDVDCLSIFAFCAWFHVYEKSWTMKAWDTLSKSMYHHHCCVARRLATLIALAFSHFSWFHVDENVMKHENMRNAQY